MIDLDARLREGPLRVRSLWSAEPGERVVKQILRRRRQLFALDLVMAACACMALAWAGLRGGLPLGPVAAHRAEVSRTAPSFADGSVAELWSRDAELRIEEDTSSRVVARLTGGARFRVVPNRERTFQVQAGDVRVRVLGTVFSIQQLPSGQTQVLVEQGRVEVAWIGGAAVLQGGEGGVFPPAELPRPKEDVQPGQNVVEPLPTTSTRGAHAEAPSSRRSWRDYALRGDYEKAYGELHASGAQGAHDDATDLMLEADVARLSGHPEQAIRPLRSLCERHSSDRRAPIAAFTLGRVLLDDLARPLEAVDAFQKARLLWPTGPLAEDALAREADAWQRAGRPERAHAIAQQYLERYPQGRHVPVLSTLLAQ